MKDFFQSPLVNSALKDLVAKIRKNACPIFKLPPKMSGAEHFDVLGAQPRIS